MTAPAPLRTALARSLSEHSVAIVEELTELLATSLPTQVSGEGEPDWFRTSIQGNVEALVHLIAYPEDLEFAEPPVGAVSLVYHYARRDLALYEVLHGYHLCELRWQQLCLEHLSKLTEDSAELVSATVEISELVRAYLQQVCDRISVEYEAERARWMRQEESARVKRVVGLLDGTLTDVAAAEEALGYRLRQRHLALIVWRDGDDSAGEHLLVQRALTKAAEQLGGLGPPLVVARDYAHVWAWIPLPAHSAIDLAPLRALAAEAPHVRVAVGDAHAGANGFVRSHREAAAARDVARAAGPEGPVLVPYREVSSLVFLCTDLTRARAWVADTLGALALDARRENELRHTVAVYCANHRSLVAAARDLNVHKNTVRFRLQAAEQLLGGTIDESGLDLDLAVRACEWLGPRLLAGS
ncbi:MAG: PucR family transcriptional regulator [Sporichthyaceae bacterium]